MKYLLLISSFLGGFIGVILDGVFFSDTILFSYALFLAPSIFVLGEIYNDVKNLQKKMGDKENRTF